MTTIENSLANAQSQVDALLDAVSEKGQEIEHLEKALHMWSERLHFLKVQEAGHTLTVWKP